jgi:hypothetical protein
VEVQLPGQSRHYNMFILVIQLHILGFCPYAVCSPRHIVVFVPHTRFVRLCLLHNDLSTLGLVVTHLKTEKVCFRNVVNIVTGIDDSTSPCQCIIDSLHVKSLSTSHTLQLRICILQRSQLKIITCICFRGRSQWPRGLRRGSAADRLLRL